MRNAYCLGLALAVTACAARVVEREAAADVAPRATTVAVLDFAFYGKRANSIEPGDSALADSATARVRAELARTPGLTLVDAEVVRRAEASPEAVAAATGRPCNVVVACARAVGEALGVRWTVMGKVSKTSNLIWIFSGQLIDVSTGALVMDDEYELKGIAAEMAPAGARVFARRAAKTMTGASTTAAARGSP